MRSVAMMLRVGVWIGVCAAGAMGRGGGAPADYDFDFVTIGSVGNAATPTELYTINQPREVGRVDYEYQLTRTEVTVGQWFEFVKAYQPYYTGSPNDPKFAGSGINFILGQYVMTHPANYPTTMSWEYAARYVNWLNNDKASVREAFENGAYDTSTFTRNADGTRSHQLVHSPNVKYWIPTEDEWVKGAFYDPNRFGKGIPGYWRSPGSQEELPISGSPAQGGQTNAGPSEGPRAVGSYPDVTSPWGLLDISGGVSEYTETTWDPFFRNRIRRGSSFGDLSFEYSDSIEFSFQAFPDDAVSGLRLASDVPEPGPVVLVPLIGFMVNQKRRVS